jgi:hypothetical protein
VMVSPTDRSASSYRWVIALLARRILAHRQGRVGAAEIFI